MTIQAINEDSGAPIPEATVRIKSKKLSKTDDSPALDATHITDANGEVNDIGTLFGTYEFMVFKESGDEILRTRVDRTIDMATCDNEACVECSINVKLAVEKEEQEITTTKPCKCEGDVTIVNVNTQQPIVGACVALVVENAAAESETARVVQTYAPSDLATEATLEITEEDDRLLRTPFSRSLIPSNREDPSCKTDWCKFEGTGSLFRYFESTATWQEAHDRCRTFGAHLASIPSMNVNRFVSSILSQPEDGGYWIGGTKQQGLWTWGDASQWNYANWAEGEPNGNNENCVELSLDESFNDVNCNSQRRFVCKKLGKYFWLDFNIILLFNHHLQMLRKIPANCRLIWMERSILTHTRQEYTSSQ